MLAAQAMVCSTAWEHRTEAMPSSSTSKSGSISASAGWERRISAHMEWMVPMRAASS